MTDDREEVAYKSLITYKYGAEAFFCIYHIYNITSMYTKFTKKLCGEILHSKTKWNKVYDILVAIDAITTDSKWGIIWINPSPSIHKLDEIVEDDSIKKSLAWSVYKTFGWDYRQILSYCWSEQLQKKLSTTAEKLGYSLEDYLSQMKKLINWDTFWSKVISWQTFARKFDILSEKFTPAKNVRDFSEVADIF